MSKPFIKTYKVGGEDYRGRLIIHEVSLAFDVIEDMLADKRNGYDFQYFVVTNITEAVNSKLTADGEEQPKPL